MAKKSLFLLVLFFFSFLQVSSGAQKKLLFIDSYHEGYPWSEGIRMGVVNTLKGKVLLKTVHMDTKRNTSEEFKKKAGKKVKELIELWEPDVVIAADDNASKYLIVPYFMKTNLPFVFCGVNWDASMYGFPTSNVTGMIEVSLLPQLLDTLKKYSNGPRVGLLGADNISNRKEAENYRKKFNIVLTEEVFVKNFDEWKKRYLELQKSVDMLLIAPPSFLTEPDDKENAANFVEKNTIIPTGFVEDWIAPYALIGYTKDSMEQGEWAAETALQILDGKPVSKIPVTSNKRANIYLNMRIAKHLKIRFPINIVKRAKFIK